jgi:hypothetical protein
MAVPLIVAMVVVAMAASAYAVYMGRKQQGSSTAPQGLESFDITQAKEGSSVPLTFGTVRINSNIIYYGNLAVIEMREKVKGGKGGGSKSQTTGFAYYLDMWHSLCEGTVSLVKTYINDNQESVVANSTLFNNGINGIYPTHLPNANPISGVAHIYYGGMYLGENTTIVPTVHFILKRTVDTPLPHQNMDNGTNPAAIIYDLLVRNHDDKRGFKTSEINLPSFFAAAEYWYSRGYGLNLSFTQQEPLYESINKVFSQVDGVIYEDSQGQINIRAYNPDAAIDYTMDSDEVYDLSIQRVAQKQLPNVFCATIRDRDQDYTERVIGEIENLANIEATGKRIVETIDLTGFCDIEAASSRLAEIAARRGYSLLMATFKVNHKFASLRPGHIISVSSDQPEFTDLIMRVDEVIYGEIDSLEIEVKATQVVEKVTDSKFNILGGSMNVSFSRQPSETLSGASFCNGFLNPLTMFEDRWFHFFAKAKDSDQYARLSYYSRATPPFDPGEYTPTAGHYTTPYAMVSDFAITASMSSEWRNKFWGMPSTGTGLTITTKQLDLTTTFAPMTRQEAFMTNRYLVVSWFAPYIDDPVTLEMSTVEFIAFESLTLVSVSGSQYTYTLDNYIRWAFWSETNKPLLMTRSEALPNSLCYLAAMDKNIVPIPPLVTWGVWGRPGNYWGEAALSKGSHFANINGQPMDFGFNRYKLSDIRFYSEVRVVIRRDGTDVNVALYIGYYTNNNGAGKGDPTLARDDNFEYPGVLTLTLDGSTVTLTSPTVSYEYSGIAASPIDLTVALRHIYSNSTRSIVSTASGILPVPETDISTVHYLGIE